MGGNPSVRSRVAASAVLIFAILWGLGDAEASFPGENGMIAFARDDGIWTVHPDGSGLVQITNGEDFQSEWSPDGAKLAFSRRHGNADGEIWVSNADGSSQQQITDSPGFDGNPTWSPTGEEIAFISRRDDPEGQTLGELYVMNADGTDVRRLTNNDAIDEFPDWSPDGTTIVFQRREVGEVNLWTINADGTGETKLTDDGVFGHPDWSPDGSKIAFRGSSPDGFTDIGVMNADGSGQSLIPLEGVDDMPVWSPDGSRIAFYSNRDHFDPEGNPNAGPSELFTTNPDGTDIVKVLEGNGQYPDWQPITQGANPTPTPSPTPAATPTPAPTPTSTPAGSQATASDATVVPGQSLTVSGGGFAPGETLTITFFSDPVALGTTTSDADGNYRTDVTIPSDATPGVHRIVVSGPGADGGAHESVVEVRVRLPLPATGSTTAASAAVGVLMLAAGLAMTARARVGRPRPRGDRGHATLSVTVVIALAASVVAVGHGPPADAETLGPAYASGWLSVAGEGSGPARGVEPSQTTERLDLTFRTVDTPKGDEPPHNTHITPAAVEGTYSATNTYERSNGCTTVRTFFWEGSEEPPDVSIEEFNAVYRYETHIRVRYWEDRGMWTVQARAWIDDVLETTIHSGNAEHCAVGSTTRRRALVIDVGGPSSTISREEGLWAEPTPQGHLDGGGSTLSTNASPTGWHLDGIPSDAMYDIDLFGGTVPEDDCFSTVFLVEQYAPRNGSGYSSPGVVFRQQFLSSTVSWCTDDLEARVLDADLTHLHDNAPSGSVGVLIPGFPDRRYSSSYEESGSEVVFTAKEEACESGKNILPGVIRNPLGQIIPLLPDQGPGLIWGPEDLVREGIERQHCIDIWSAEWTVRPTSWREAIIRYTVESSLSTIYPRVTYLSPPFGDTVSRDGTFQGTFQCSYLNATCRHSVS